MIRILQIGMSPLIGGVESFIVNYGEKITNLGITFDYIAMYNHIAYEERIKNSGGKIYYLCNVKRNPIKFFKQLVYIASKYDTVHINMLSAANSLPIYACKIAKVKNIIVHSHNSRTERADRFILHYLNKMIINNLDIKRLSCSEVAARWMFTKKQVNKCNYTVIHNAIDLNKYVFKEEFRREIRNEFAINDYTLLIGNVGHLTLQKNPLFLIDVFNECVKLREDIKLILVGDGDLTDEVKDRIRRYSIEDKVIFAGIRYDAFKFYSAMDIFCMTSLYEGLSFTAVEGQASGVKCYFSTGISVETKMVPNVEFVDLNSPSEWARRIIHSNRERCVDAGEYIKNKGFDINFELFKLAELYRSYR